MQIEKKTKTVSEEYCCSNPNCKTVFSQPKIIKYYVCPKCQSFVEMKGVSSQPVIVDPMDEENLCLLEEYHSLNSKKLEEIEYLKTNIKNKIEEIQKQKTENANINKKLDDTKNDLDIVLRKFESTNSKFEAKDAELVEVVEKNLGLIKRVELFEAERASDSLKIREDAGRLAGLEEKLSEKDGYIILLDKRLAELRGEVGKLTKQRDDAVRDKNDVIAEKVKVESKACQELEAKDEELAEVVEKNLGLIKRVELFEAERASDSLKIREDAGRLAGLEEKLSEKDGYVANLNNRLGGLRDLVKNLTEQREVIIKEKNESIAKQIKAEKKAYHTSEERDRLQSELTNLRDKLANSIKKDDKISEKRMLDAKKNCDLELEIKTSKENKQLEKIKIPKSKDINFDQSVNKVQELELKKIKIKKQEKSVEGYDLNAAKFPYPKQVISNKNKRFQI